MTTLVTEQQDLSLRAACSTPSLNRLNKRLLLLERYLIALSRKGEETGDSGGVVGEGEREEEEEEKEKADGEREKVVEEERCAPGCTCMY